MKKIVISNISFLVLLCLYATVGAVDSFYTYDANGRLLQCNYANSTMIRYTYDEVGNITKIVSYNQGGFVDSDNDGIDDGWERFYFGTLATANDVTDFDNDGYIDFEEYLLWTAGTLDDNILQFNPLIYNYGDQNNKQGSNILLMIVPVISVEKNHP